MVNKVILIGNLGKDPELKTFDDGKKVCRFTIATSDAYKDKNGEWQDQTEWHTVVVWGDSAERAEKQLKKGGKVYVEGKVTHRKYTQDGAEKYAYEVVASMFRSLEKREGEAASAVQTQSSAPVQKSAPVSEPTRAESDSDLPF